MMEIASSLQTESGPEFFSVSNKGELSYLKTYKLVVLAKLLCNEVTNHGQLSTLSFFPDSAQRLVHGRQILNSNKELERPCKNW